ncbi:LysE family translocator [Vibrio sp. WXL103]|uniref:LysE family translocator n=1 Tax=Vibrio sp. WXL103 TaxID=3450710 RepID=UPI003EC4F664
MNELLILGTLTTVHLIGLMSPGPDFALVVQNATRYGRQTGVYIALGLSIGILLHSILSLTGVSYLIHQQPLLYTLIQLAGGSYLAYLGLGALHATWKNRHCRGETSALSRSTLKIDSLAQAFRRGFITNILNPKALVFFVSLMSSLVPAEMSLSGKTAALVLLWLISFVWFGGLAWLLSAPRLQKKLLAVTPFIDSLCGLVFSSVGFTIIYHSLNAWLGS